MSHLRPPLERGANALAWATILSRFSFLGNHDVLRRSARRNHGIDVLFRVDHQVHDAGFLGAENLLEGFRGVLGRLRPEALDAVGLGQLDEIGLGGDGRGSVALLEEQVLPLLDHAQELVVEDDDLHVEVVLFHHGQFLERHLETAVAGDIDHRGVRISEGGPDGGREPETHGAQPARGDPSAWLVEAVILGRPHLVLAHLGRDDGIALGQAVDLFHRELGQDGPVGVLLERQRMFLVPGIQLVIPFVVIMGAGRFGQRFQDGLHVAQHMGVHLHVLVDGGRVHVDVDLLGEGRELGQLARHPVVEAAADGDQQVAMGQSHVGPVGPVHAQHVDELAVIGWIGPQTHQGQGDRDIGLAGEFVEGVGGPGVDDPAPGVDQGTAWRGGAIRPSYRSGNKSIVGTNFESGDGGMLGIGHFRRGGRDILGDIDQNRPGPPAPGDEEGVPQDLGQFLDAFHQVIVLGAGAGDSDHVGFLERVGPDQWRRAPGR